MMKHFEILRGALVASLLILTPLGVSAQVRSVYIEDTPDYAWHRGCFGTASGNLMGFWDRNGFSNIYEGPANGGVAPLNSNGSNSAIYSMWASVGHDADYWVQYETDAQDPYATEGRQEHAPDCIGDFIGLNQNKWKGLNGECDGNIDGFSFVFWDKTGARRWNYQPTFASGEIIPDIPSGLKRWMEYRGYDCNVYSQLAEVNDEATGSESFSFDDLTAEIDAGFPVLLYLQDSAKLKRQIGSMKNANPSIHAFMVYGYRTEANGDKRIRVRTSWGSGDNMFYPWNSSSLVGGDLPIRGVIVVRPSPRIHDVERTGSNVSVTWSGPSANLNINQSSQPAHWYVVEKSRDLVGFEEMSEPTAGTTASFNDAEESAGSVFYRVRTLLPAEVVARGL